MEERAGTNSYHKFLRGEPLPKEDLQRLLAQMQAIDRIISASMLKSEFALSLVALRNYMLDIESMLTHRSFSKEQLQ